jgi:hypothetical protein
VGGSVTRTVTTRFLRAVGAAPAVSQHALLPSGGSARHNLSMGRKDKGREICINCGQTFHKKLTSKELRCTKCRKAEKKAA